MGLWTKAEIALLDKAFDYVGKNPEKNIDRVISLACKLNTSGRYDREINGVKKLIADKDGLWYQYFLSLFRDIDPDVLKRFFKNFVINASILGVPAQAVIEKETGLQIPWNFQIDITSACNLRCKGCWAADYGHTLNLSYEELDNIITQGEEMFTHYYIFSGGEPLMRKKDLIKIAENHPDSLFMVFTNATLVDQAFCDELLRVQNIVLVPSVEGIGKATDFRRGEGTYAACVKAIELLKKNKLLFGLSCCYTRQTCERIGSDDWYNQMLEWGAKFAWFFLYMPVGNSAQPEMMVTAEQRKWMYDSVHAHRKTHGIFVLDFWNDGEHVDGCLAGGKSYIHINANGDIEPCAFIHYSNHNIRNATIMEALDGPLFRAYREGQPFNKNPLRPCPLLDNPDALQQMVEVSGAKSTDMESPEDVKHLTDKTRPAADAWSGVADEIIEKKYGTVCANKTCDTCRRANRCPDKH